MTPNRSHYRKTSPTTVIDVYRVLQLFEVTDPCIQHAIKKLLAAGKRGAKDIMHDIAEAIESLERWQEMREEEYDESMPMTREEWIALPADAREALLK